MSARGDKNGFKNLAIHWGMQHGDEPFPEGVSKVTENTRQMLSENFGGRTHSLETRQKMSEAHSGKNNVWYGKRRSDGTSSKVAESMPDMSGENNPMYGKHHSEETRRKIAEAIEGNTHSEETKQKMSEARSGENNVWYGKRRSEETCRKIAESLEGKRLTKEHKENMSKAMLGREFTEEHKQKISDAQKGRVIPDEVIRKALRNVGSNGVCNIPTKRTLRSDWEREIDLLLYDAGFEFEYEPEIFEIGGGRKYTPDFRVGGNIIEVKGRLFGGEIQNAARFMREHPKYRYIVVGTELPADVWIPWNDRETLLKIL